MSVSAFLSMWISNTATTAMMLPIAHAVLMQLRATEARADAREAQAADGEASDEAQITAKDNEAFELEEKDTEKKETGEDEKRITIKVELKDKECE